MRRKQKNKLNPRTVASGVKLAGATVGLSRKASPSKSHSSWPALHNNMHP